MKINNTPVRTSKNFGINDIDVDVDFPKEIKEFNNFSVKQDSYKDEILEIEGIENEDVLKYGVGFLQENISHMNKQILVNINSKMDNNIRLFFDFDKNNSELVESIRICAKESTKSTVYILFKSNGGAKAFHSGMLFVNAEKNAKVNIILINMLNSKSDNFYSIENSIREGADVRYTIVDFGGENSISNLYSSLEGDRANNIINAIYLGKKDELIDMNYIGELFGKKSNIKIEVQGALKDKSRKHFKGTIDFKKGCKKSTGDENENCMLLSDEAKSMALPMLLCSEEDVEGNHSTSSGKAGEKELFYIMSRGFSEKDAMKLLVRAKFNSIIETIKDKGIKEFILKEIDERLD